MDVAVCIVILCYVAHSAYSKVNASISLSPNPVYPGQQETITCSLEGDGVTVLSVTLDSFDKTEKIGTLSCRRDTKHHAATGKFEGHFFDQCSITNVMKPSFKVVIIASASWDLTFQCTIEAIHSNENYTAFNVTSRSLYLSVYDQAHLTIDRERIYEKEHCDLNCSFPSHLSLSRVSLNAFNGTSEKGSTLCSVFSGTITQTGVFSGSTVAGCPAYPPGSGYVLITMQASRSLELNYSCTVVVFDGSQLFNLTSSTTQIELSVMPEPVFLNHGALNFNESDNVTIECYSKLGKPPAIVSLTVTQEDRSTMQDIGNVSAFLQLPQSKRLLNNAIVTCKVTNHLLSQNMTYQGVLNINYLIRHKQTYYEADTTHNSATLNCSASSNPPAVYIWEIPAEIKGSFSQLNDSFVVPEHSSGKVRCTILNTGSKEQDVVTFDVKSSVMWPLVGILVTVSVIIGVAVSVFVYLRCRSNRLAWQDGKSRTEHGQRQKMQEPDESLISEVTYALWNPIQGQRTQPQTHDNKHLPYHHQLECVSITPRPNKKRFIPRRTLSYFQVSGSEVAGLWDT